MAQMTAADRQKDKAASEAGKRDVAVKEGMKKLEEEAAAAPSLGDIARRAAEARRKREEEAAKAAEPKNKKKEKAKKDAQLEALSAKDLNK